jgi:23S rRNA (pseudouridine1915-N3)-methyltransferase
MEITILFVGKPAQSPVLDYEQELLKRLQGAHTVHLISVSAAPESMRLEEAKREEGKRLLAKIPKRSTVWVLDERGTQYTSHQFAALIERTPDPITLIIGGAYGLSAEVLAMTTKQVALSAMTLPHHLARLVLVEQLYRAHTITTKHPYHK